MYGIKRRGFAMILAIVVVLMIGVGGALLMNSSTMGAKSMSDNYLRAQGELIAQSATEYALMRAQGFDTSGGDCLNHLLITVEDASGTPMYDANVTMFYSFQSNKPAGGGTCECVENTGKATTILIDTVVTDNNLATEPIRIQKRSIQTF